MRYLRYERKKRKREKPKQAERVRWRLLFLYKILKWLILDYWWDFACRSEFSTIIRFGVPGTDHDVSSGINGGFCVWIKRADSSCVCRIKRAKGFSIGCR